MPSAATYVSGTPGHRHWVYNSLVRSPCYLLGVDYIKGLPAMTRKVHCVDARGADARAYDRPLGLKPNRSRIWTSRPAASLEWSYAVRGVVCTEPSLLQFVGVRDVRVLPLAGHCDVANRDAPAD